MARRKKRKFGSPPEVHKRRARYELAEARISTKAVRNYLNNGNCAGALNTLLHAERLLGFAFANIKGMERPYRRTKPTSNRALNSLITKFKTQCMKPRR
jgi:hypothetical protein